VKLSRLKLERVVVLRGRRAVGISVASIIIAFTFFSIFLLLEGADPIDAYAQVFSYALTPELGLPATIHRSIFLLFSTLAFILPGKAGLWNIGMEGQFYLGTVGMFAVAYAYGNLSPEILIPLLLVAAGLLGAVYGMLAGFLRGKWGVNEIVITLMLNNIGYWLLYTLVVGGPWMGISESASKPLPVSAQAPMIWRTPFTIFLAPLISAVLYFLFARSSIGYQIRILGSSQPAAQYAGTNPLKISIFVMAVGGAIAGLSAYHMWAGDPAFYRIPRPDGYKALGDFTYWGSMVGLLCVLNPIASIPVSFFIGAIKEGGTVLVRRLGLTYGLDYVFLGVLFLTFVALQFFYQYRVIRKKKV
jgi:ABC-type uncharacterized transport system permease subunit